MPKLYPPAPRLICFGGARALTNAGPGEEQIEVFPDDLYDG